MCGIVARMIQKYGRKVLDEIEAEKEQYELLLNFTPKDPNQ